MGVKWIQMYIDNIPIYVYVFNCGTIIQASLCCIDTKRKSYITESEN